jgi:hypothetical protein
MTGVNCCGLLSSGIIQRILRNVLPAGTEKTLTNFGQDMRCCVLTLDRAPSDNNTAATRT